MLQGDVRPLIVSPASWLVGLAGSSGGLHALHHVLGALPPAFPAAIAVVQHRLSGNERMLGDLLSRWTRLRVRDAEEGDVLAAGTVFIAPADRHMRVTLERTIALARGAPIHHVLSSADPLFTSGALAYGPRFIAVVLTGGDGDGSDGVRHVRRRHGTVIAQDPATASNDEMPRHAIATGVVDMIVPLDQIAGALVRLVTVSSLPEPEPAAPH
jgi:two-component system, chemotaxis family, protein-glutamate methylesterase/glutaminase